MAKRKSTKTVPDSRFRFNVPADDICVLEWVNCQHNLSLSVRMLIKGFIEQNGMRDLFSSEAGEIVQLPKRGRPSNAEKLSKEAAREMAEATLNDEEEGFVSLSDEESEEEAIQPEASEFTPEQQKARDKLSAMMGLLDQ